MSNFSDHDDRILLQLVKAESERSKRLNWKRIAENMLCTGKNRNELRGRLNTLKKTYGKDLKDFPPRFFTPKINNTRQKPKSVRMKKTNKQKLVEFGKGPSTDVTEALLLLASKTNHSTIHSSEQIQNIIKKMFQNITLSDILQPSGSTDFNSGEITVEGISSILLEIPDLSVMDSFADIGSGIGNILAQVALETPVRMCFGIECRPELVNIARRAFKAALKETPTLAKVNMTCEDIRAPRWHTEANLRACTVLYSNNLVFRPDANLQLEAFVTSENRLRYVVVFKKFCCRHRDGCQRLFCTLWQLQSIVRVTAHWCSGHVDAFIYKRKNKM